MKNLLFIILLLIPCIAGGQVLNVSIINIRDLKGQICVAIFRNQSEFTSEKTYWETKCPKCKVIEHELKLKIQLRPGKYGLSVLDDENDTGRMEYRLFGIPREGFGFANYIQQGIHKPTFDDFSFMVSENETKNLTVRMKYF
jgi:uncharacterized protein (DUF2141 family)